MRLDEARALRDRLLQRPPARLADALGAPARDRPAALGIARVAPGEYALAVRSQGDLPLGPAALEALTAEAGGEIDVRHVGRVRALQGPDRRRRARPLELGLSVGHPRVTAGTLGCFVGPPGGATAILSNNHVLADEGRAQEGDAALQPGTADGGSEPEDVVGRLERFVPLRADAANVVDCAIARLVEGVDADTAGVPGSGRLDPTPVDVRGDEAVLKVGRTTGRTTGRVTAFGVSGLRVRFDQGELRFDDQVEIEGDEGDFSRGGDSGSLVLAADGLRPLGLLFAGGASITYANPIGAVLQALGVEVRA